MKNITHNLYYWRGNNFGDELNKIIFEKLFQHKFSFTNNIHDANIIAIGSILDLMIINDTIYDKIIQVIYYFGRRKRKKLVVLGSGFREQREKIKLFKKLDVKILRGKLTFDILKKNSIIMDNIVFGDPGILAPFLIDEIPQKKYQYWNYSTFK